jgi:hypothetical protein
MTGGCNDLKMCYLRREVDVSCRGQTLETTEIEHYPNEKEAATKK